MRTLEIHRPKRMLACAMKMTVEIDGKKIGKLANGKALSTTIDEQPHELRVRFGILSGRKASSRLMIPAGSFSYALQTEIMELTNGSKPVLLPHGGASKEEPSRVVQLMVSTLTATLLDQELRNTLAKVPEAQLQLVAEEQQWELAVCARTERKTLMVQPYSQRKGSLLDVALNAIDHRELQSPEDRDKFACTILTKYLQHLPDYQQVGNHELVFQGAL